jgi:complement component 1 Q subcomponent-binding protein
MELNVTAEGDSFFIDNVAYSNDSSKMTDLSPVADYERKQLYSGPQFEQLDEQVQETFLEFLEERGFDKGFAQFAKQYLEYKEQNEYVNWLEGVEAFVKGK